MTEGLNIRKDILGYSLLLENTTSFFLAALLGIKDSQDSITLGNKSSSLSFNNKIDLLIDIGALDRNTKSKFQTFMEVRNQFMHNGNAKDYVSCYSYISGKQNFVLKNYPQAEELAIEEQLKNATDALANDVIDKAFQLIHKLKEKATKDAKHELYLKSHQALVESISETIKEFNETIEKEFGKTEDSKLKPLKLIGSKIFNGIIQRWKEKV